MRVDGALKRIISRVKHWDATKALKSNDASWKKKREDFSNNDDETDAHPPPLEENDPYLMNLEERQEWRQKIRDVIGLYPNIQEEVGPVEFPRNNGYYIASWKIHTSNISLMSYIYTTPNKTCPNGPEATRPKQYKQNTLIQTITNNNPKPISLQTLLRKRKKRKSF